jgi:leukotriene-A4 hydrolase
LNEGWTTYIERLLQELIHQSPGRRGLSYVIGYKALVDALELFQSNGTPEYQRLVIAFRFGEDPDAAYSSVPYDKGANFILLLGASNEHIELPWILTKSFQNEPWEVSMSCFRISRTM